MHQEIVTLITLYGLPTIFLSVLIEQGGLPVPATPVLLVAGAVAATGQLPVWDILLVALIACLFADLMWYRAGRYFGARVLRTLCSLSLSPDSCVRQSELRFDRWRGQLLLVAKFIPGLSTVAPPLVGALGLPLRTFLLFDSLGSLFWIGVSVGLGYAFSAQINQLLEILATFSTVAAGLLAGLFALYLLIKWWRRRGLLNAQRMARISVDQLHHALGGGEPPIVVDVRSAIVRELDPQIINGALLGDIDHIVQTLNGIPFDRELVIYCDCPHEETAVRVAEIMIAHGYRHARPLQGGLIAWKKAGYSVVPIACEKPPEFTSTQSVVVPSSCQIQYAANPSARETLPT